MESEEVKPVQAGIDSPHGQIGEGSESERRQVEKNHGSVFQEGIDSSHGLLGEGSDSERRQVECEQVEKNQVSGVQAGIDSSLGQISESSDSEPRQVEKNDVPGVHSGGDAAHGQLGDSSKIHQVKRKRDNKKNDSRKQKRMGRNFKHRTVHDHISDGPQAGIDSSNRQMGEGSQSERRQVKRRRVEKSHVSGVPSGGDAAHGKLGDSSKIHQVKRKRDNKKHDSRKHGGFIKVGSNDPGGFHGITVVSVELKYAKIALKNYERKQDANTKFKILQVLFSSRAILAVPGVKGYRDWFHVVFTAKPKNSNCSGRHFFGEMVLNPASKRYHVTYCSVFEPSDLGNVKGCVFCPDTEVFLHPPDGCPAGGRKVCKSMARKGKRSSKGQVHRCSKRHQGRSNFLIRDAEASEMMDKAEKAINLKYAKIALDFFEKSKGAKFAIVDAFQSMSKQVVVPGSKSIQEWCHVCFVAKPSNADCTNFTPKYFFGELLLDTNTGEYNATYCEIFKPFDDCVTHNCVICPELWDHPFTGYRVGRPPYSIPEETLLD